VPGIAPAAPRSYGHETFCRQCLCACHHTFPLHPYGHGMRGRLPCEGEPVAWDMTGHTMPCLYGVSYGYHTGRAS